MAKIRDQGKALFMERFQLIEELIARLAARHQLTEDESQEVYSLVMLKIIQDDYAVLRRFRAQSRWSTYLTVVIQRVLLDQRTREWGRWRPCAVARRLGKTAIELDRWINREGLETEEAVQMMLVGEWGTTVDELRKLVEQIPKRPRHRVLVGEGCLADLPERHGADRRADLAEQRAVVDDLSVILRSALGELSSEDRVLLALRFQRGWTVRQIAAELDLEQRPLYRRFERILRRLRWRLEGHGLGWEEIADLLDEEEPEMHVEALQGVDELEIQGRRPQRTARSERIARARSLTRGSSRALASTRPARRGASPWVGDLVAEPASG